MRQFGFAVSFIALSLVSSHGWTSQSATLPGVGEPFAAGGLPDSDPVGTSSAPLEPGVPGSSGQGEIARLVAIEQANLAGLALELDARERELSRRDAEPVGYQENVLRWRRLVADVPDAATADRLYPSLRADLRSLRQHFDDLLGEASRDTRLPALWPDPLAGIASEAIPPALAVQRAALARRISDLAERERESRNAQVAAIDASVGELNRLRLAMLSQLSSSRREDITGFTPAGFDQVRAEAWQLSLIAQYHAHLLGGRLSRDSDGISFGDAWRWGIAAVPIVLCCLLFLVSRRVTMPLLQAREREMMHFEFARAVASPLPLRRGLRFLMAVWVPLERCLFFLALVWLVPAELYVWLEFRLLVVIVGWMVFGLLIVHVLNSLPLLLAMALPSEYHVTVDGLRLRSLRLLGRYFIGVSVLLAVTAELVGKGSIYRWVASVSWLLMVVPAVILLHWWREAIFENAERFSSVWRVLRLVATHRQSVLRPLAQAVGGIAVLLLLIWMHVRRFADRYDLARRARSLLGREATGSVASVLLNDVPDRLRVAYSPDVASAKILESPLHRVQKELDDWLKTGHGGLVAVVGGRGSGRTTLLATLAQRWRVASVFNGMDLHDHGPASWPSAAVESGRAGVVLIDDAHNLFSPRPGGLALFDRFIAHARQEASTAPWVMVLDDVAWAFLQRARDDVGVFDRVIPMSRWSEADIRELVALRNAAEGIDPQPLPSQDGNTLFDDPVFQAEEQALRQSACYRMVWNFARGNPALALDAWARALQCGATGEIVVDTRRVDRVLPLDASEDSYLFVLKVILMTEPAKPETVSSALDMAEARVTSLLLTGVQRGHLHQEHGRYRVGWSWRRAVIDMLERKHLLVKP